MNTIPDQQKLRIDKWLWAARFFKTRALSAQAVTGGKVHANGNRVKPAYTVRVGDELRIRHGFGETVVIVRALSATRRPAKEAGALYEETAESRQARELLAEQRRMLAASTLRPPKRPSKQDRRRIIQFKTKSR